MGEHIKEISTNFLFFPRGGVLQGSELSGKFAKINVTQCDVSRIF